MATTIVKTTANGTRDYPPIQAWEDAAPANLVTSDQVWEGQLYPEGAGTYGEWTITAAITISGSTSDATRFMRLRCAAGASFSDNASAATNTLRYNPANGVAIRQTNGYGSYAIDVSQAYTELVGLQLSNFNGAPTLYLGANTTVSNCVSLHSGGHASVNCSVANSKVINSVLIGTGSYACIRSSVAPIALTGCTLSRPTGTGALASAAYGGAVLMKGCAAFGFTNATGVSASSSYNATDLASFPGSNNQLSLTASSQFENTTTATLDLRAKAGNGLQFGVTDALIATDIIGQTRAATPTIGAWEFGSGGGGGTDATAPGATLTGTSSISAGSASGGSGGTDATAPGATLTGTSSISAGSASGSGGAGTFVSDAMENNTGAGLLASTSVTWTWWQGAIGATPTSLTHGSGTTSAGGILSLTGLPTGAGFLIARTADSAGVYYQPGTVT